MGKRVALSVITIILCAVVIAGGTMAWFTHKTDTETTTFTAGTVSITAGRKIDINDSDTFEEHGTFTPDKVIEAVQGDSIGKIAEDRCDHNAVLRTDNRFFSLGFGGYIIVEFEYPVFAPELVIVTEVTDGTYPLEKADVYVSATGTDDDWEYAGTADNDISKRKGNSTENSISLEDVNVQFVKYVKIVDTTDRSLFSAPGSDGFDVRSIQVRGYYIDEYNWNPGDKNTRLFEITNTGTKAIHLRGKFTGNWYIYNKVTGEWEKDETLSADVVTIGLHEDEDGWTVKNGWFYYKYTIPGTFPDKLPTSVNLKLNVGLKGEDADDNYQGKKFILNGSFEAIQASNGASEAKGWDYIPVNKPE